MSLTLEICSLIKSKDTSPLKTRRGDAASMNFPLKNIERHLDETSLLRGEELLADQRVQSLTEIERHLWIAKVRDERLYEVEAKISPSRVLAATCECERYGDIGICEHLAALFLLLRRRQTAKKEERKAKRQARKSPRKLTTGAVLDSISHEELAAFVRQYAKTNRNFALALKARFAPQVSLEETREKYVQLLESAISMARKANRGISVRGSRKIYKLLVEIQSQIDDAIARRYYADAFHIIQSVIEKITPLLKKLERNQEEIQTQVEQAFRALEEIVRAQPAPALKAEIWEYCLAETSKLRFRSNGLDRRFFRTMLHLADERHKKEQLVEALSVSLYKYESEGRNPAPVLLLQLEILELMDQPEEMQRLFDRYLAEPDILRYAVRQAMRKSNLARAKMLAQSGLQRQLPAGVRAEMETILLEIAEKERDASAIIDLSFRRLLRSKDIRYARKIREWTDVQWPAYRRKAIDALQDEPFSVERQQLIAQILTEDKQWESLLRHLETARSLELLQQFDEPLLPRYRQAVYDLYRKMLAEYIRHHLGRKPSARIRHTLHHLTEIKADDLVEELVALFRNEYPERHTLMEELSLF